MKSHSFNEGMGKNAQKCLLKGYEVSINKSHRFIFIVENIHDTTEKSKFKTDV